MKRIFTNLSIFIALVFTLSSFTACQKNGSAQQNTTNANQPAETATGEKPKTANDGKYPPLPEAIATAEIRMLDGTTFKMTDKKGKVVLINLWATWCGPCREEMPALVEMQDKYKDKDFEIIGLDTDEEETVEMIQEFAQEMKLNYPLGYADGKMFNQFVKLTGLQGIPQSVLVNREGKMTGIFTGGSKKVIEKMKQTVEKTVNE